ncbi:MAG: TonB-dependent receptor [Tannerella sp.]|jgi:TonB-linked SusC/RagA family outer membrane protein|nr:TonB-dependent receptor [Tannerella sp.]
MKIKVFRNTLRILKLTMLLISFTALQAKGLTAYSPDAKVKITRNNLSIGEFIKEVEEQTDFLFLFSEKEIDLSQQVQVSVRNSTVEEVLKDAFSSGVISYSINDNYISLHKKALPAPTQRSKKVTGAIKDATGEPVVGASIAEKGTTNGTVTDDFGNFSLEVDNNAVLKISYIGYTAQEIIVGSQTDIQITLQEDTQALEEVVVIGYGTQKKVNLTGAVSTISEKVIESRPIHSTIDAMQGTIPGLTVQSSGGQPGAFSTLKIRGNTSINSGGALILIDGLPGDINLVNPLDIESISVLKDAASAAIYGARAAEGVILITTKTGQSEKIKIEYSGNFSYNTPTRVPQSNSGLEHMEMANAAFALAKMSAPYPEEALEARRNNSAVSIPSGAGWIFTADTDWIDMLLNHTTQQSHNLTISKSSSGLKYLFSAGWLDENGFFSEYADDNYSRVNIRSNVKVNLAKKLSFDTKISFANSTQNYLPTVQGQWSIPYILFVQAGPTMPIYDENGHYSRYRRQCNVMQQIKEGGEAYNKGQRADGVATLDYMPIDELKLSALGGVTFNNIRGKEFKRTVERWGPLGLLEVAVGQGNPSTISQYVSNNTYLIGQFTADYKKKLGSHDFAVLLGVSYESNDYESLEASRDDILANILPSLNLGTNNINNNAPQNQWALLSFFSRINYEYASKYLFELQLRGDASSRFSKKNRWGIFPSASLAWRIIEEQFMKDQTIFSNLKLRASWGEMGNQNGLGFYDHIAQYNVGGYYPFSSEPKAQWVLENSLPSEDRTWETVEVKNIAIETGFLKNRLNATFDYFVKRNKNMLMSVAIPSVIGINVPTGNYGELMTKGWEISLSWNDKIGDVFYNIGVNVSDQIDKLVNYTNKNISATYGGAADGSQTSNVYTQGYSMGAYFGYKTDGYFQSAEEAASYPHINDNPNVTAGDIKYLDINDDGKVNSPGDLTYIGNRVPRYVFGANFGITWKEWNLSLLFQGVGKRDFYLASNSIAPFVFEYGNTSYKHQRDAWTPDNPDALLPRHIVGATYNYQSSDHWIQDASYLRLKNLQFGYTFSREWIKRIGVDRLRAYFSGENIFEVTNLIDAYDPELTIAGGYMYPLMRNFSFGLNINF